MVNVLFVIPGHELLQVVLASCLSWFPNWHVPVRCGSHGQQPPSQVSPLRPSSCKRYLFGLAAESCLGRETNIVSNLHPSSLAQGSDSPFSTITLFLKYFLLFLITY